MIKILNGIILAGLIFGRMNHKKRKLHVRTMMAFISMDILLVLYLSFIGNVLRKLNSQDMYPLLVVHILMALVCVVGYLLTIKYGLKLLKGDESARKPMRILDRVVMPLRIGVFLTSLFLG